MSIRHNFATNRAFVIHSGPYGSLSTKNPVQRKTVIKSFFCRRGHFCRLSLNRQNQGPEKTGHFRKFTEKAFSSLHESASPSRCNPAGCKPEKTGKSAKTENPEAYENQRFRESKWRDSIPFAQWSPETLGAGFVLPFALTNSGRFRLRRTAHRAGTSLVCRGRRGFFPHHSG